MNHPTFTIKSGAVMAWDKPEEPNWKKFQGDMVDKMHALTDWQEACTAAKASAILVENPEDLEELHDAVFPFTKMGDGKWMNVNTGVDWKENEDFPLPDGIGVKIISTPCQDGNYKCSDGCWGSNIGCNYPTKTLRLIPKVEAVEKGIGDDYPVIPQSEIMLCPCEYETNQGRATMCFMCTGKKPLSSYMKPFFCDMWRTMKIPCATQCDGCKQDETDQHYKNAHNENKYPIGGYAPGSYMCKCATCQTEFFGDKRAVQCEPCAIKTTAAPVEAKTVPTWFDKNEIFHWLKRADYSDTIAGELAELITNKLQGAFKIGYEKGQQSVKSEANKEDSEEQEKLWNEFFTDINRSDIQVSTKWILTRKA